MADVGDIEDIGKKIHTCEVISISRRTDIPAFYMKEFVKHMEAGYVDVPNPRNPSQISRVSLNPKNAKCLAWWSKDYEKWIKMYAKNQELFDRYPAHVFNFTLNSDSDLEPGVKKSVDQRLKQVEWLASVFGPHAVNLRFDPIVHYQEVGSDEVVDNLDDFEHIVKSVAEFGIDHIVFSFCIPFPKTRSRMRRRGKILCTLNDKQQHEVLDRLIDICDRYDMKLAACCDTGLVGYKGKIVKSACISAEVIDKILGEKGLHKKSKDRGQRAQCNCVISRDVGSYEQECKHSCDYCYANPTE